jgi:hypothetical protein
MNEVELFAEVKQFAALQKELVNAWRKACANSRSMRTLADFPWRQEVVSSGLVWIAIKHGSGVRFERESMEVDAESHVWETDWFEPNRVYDYLQSKNRLGLIDQSIGRGRRMLLYDIFEQWAGRGLVVRREEDPGRPMYSLVQAGTD